MNPNTLLIKCCWLFAIYAITPILFAESKPSMVHNSSNSAFNLSAISIVKRVESKQFCSGVLISERLVLTALHCVQGIGRREPYAVESFRVGFGPSVDSAKTNWHTIQEIRLAKDLILDNVEALRGNDFAVLVLSSIINTKPILLAERPLLSGDNNRLLVAGFGEDRFGIVGLRHTTDVSLTDNEGSKLAFVGGGCMGDSGGPILNKEGKLVGLLSFGTSKHCTPNVVRFGEPLVTFKSFVTAQNRSFSGVKVMPYPPIRRVLQSAN